MDATEKDEDSSGSSCGGEQICSMEVEKEYDTLPAFSNVLIAQNIIKYLDLRSIVNFRAVCKTLNEFASPVVEQRIDEFQIHISSIKDLQRYMDIENSFKYTNFLFNEVDFSDPVVEEFFRNPHHEITSLALKYTRDDNMTSEQFHDLLVNKLPNLNKLEIYSLPESVRNSPFGSSLNNDVQFGITSLSCHVSGSEEYSPTFLQGFYIATPLVHEFSLTVRMDDESSFDRGITLSLFKDFIQRPQQEVICSLDIKQLDPLVWFMLVQLYGPFNFRSLKAHTLDFGDNYLISSVFFLNQHKDSLEVLELESSDPTPFTLGFPVMPNLKSLCILCIRGCATIEDIDWGLRFQALKKLRICHDVKQPDYVASRGHAPPTSIFTASSTPCPTVIELEFSKLVKRGQELLNIARIFPNVTKLALSMSVHNLSVLKSIWEFWPGLEVLALALDEKLSVNSKSKQLNDRQLDSFFTGLSVDTCRDLYASDLLQACKDESLEEPVPIAPAMSHVNGLKYIFLRAGLGFAAAGHDDSLEDSHGNSKCKISNVTGLISFLNMENLQGLIVDSRLHEISSPCIEFVSDKLGLIDMSDKSIGNSSDSQNLHLVRYNWQTKFSFNLNDISQYPRPCIGWDIL